MGWEVVKRLALAIPTLLGVTLVTFLILQIVPGDPAQIAAGITSADVDSTEVTARLRTFMGLDQPLVWRYLTWLHRAVTLDFGLSFQGKPVSQLLGQTLPPTLLLGTAALILGFLVSIPLGVLSAAKAGKKTDRFLGTLLLALYSIPPWISGLILILIFGFWLEWLPFAGWHSRDYASMSFLGKGADLFKHGILILIATTLPGLAHDTRFVRQAVLEELSQQYVMAARSLGLPEWRVLWGHAFRGALVPIITLLGLSIPSLLAGSVILEEIFSWPGMGRLFFYSLDRRDYPVIMAITTLVAFLVVLGNLMADILCKLADPRLKP